MTTMRIKVKLPMIKSREEAESVMNELATAANAQRNFLVLRDDEVLAINSKYEVDLAECGEVLKDRTDALRAWAESNPDAFTKGRKSIEMLSGSLGFRTGTPKLAVLSRAFNWDKVLDLVKSAAGWKGFVRSKDELDKEGVLAAAAAAPDKTAYANELKRVGLQVKQDETFFVEPKLTGVESRQVQKAV
jgi:phage host-nuclease inhibitor protein Gam